MHTPWTLKDTCSFAVDLTASIVSWWCLSQSARQPVSIGAKNRTKMKTLEKVTNSQINLSKVLVVENSLPGVPQ